MIPKEVEESEKDIIAEFKKLGLRVFFKIIRVDPKTSAWEHNVGFYDIPTKEENDKVWEIIRKYYGKWKNRSS